MTAIYGPKAAMIPLQGSEVGKTAASQGSGPQSTLFKDMLNPVKEMAQQGQAYDAAQVAMAQAKMSELEFAQVSTEMQLTTQKMLGIYKTVMESTKKVLDLPI